MAVAETASGRRPGAVSFECYTSASMYRSMYSSVLQRRRRFHRLGITAAVTAMAIGAVVIAVGAVRLQLWEVQNDVLAIIVGFSVVALGAVCIAIYGVVRAIGWIIEGFAS